MNYQTHIDDIRRKFPNKEFLFVDDIAAILSRSPKAIRSLVERGKLPQANKKRGGRVGCTVSEMAEFLSEGDEPLLGRKKPPRDTSKFILKPPTSRGSLAAMIVAARIQSEFAFALALELERISLQGKSEPDGRVDKTL
ncbi:MAG: helix-turn-helix domain-containing protein [Betaproteobacteria bacterium]